MEAVLLSIPQSFLILQSEKKHKWATIFQKLKNNIDKPLSAILSLNTVAHTIGAAGVGAQAVKVFGEVYFGLVSVILTILILVFTEIIPKTIGARYCKSLGKLAAYIIQFMIFFTYPIVITSSFISKLFSKDTKESSTSREEFSALANIGTDEGIFGEHENILIQNIIRLKNVKVSEIMTPRVVVAAADESMSLEYFLERKDFLRFSRIPVFTDNSENITGYILRQNAFEQLAEDRKGMLLKDIKRDIVIVHESIPLFKLWETLLEKREYIALVIDEYGGVAGIVTMEDVVESVLGFEIIDEKDTISDMQEYARERWKMRQIKYNYLQGLKNENTQQEEL